MKLAYSTYALQSFDVFDVIPRVAAIGYDALELNVGDAWPTAPGWSTPSWTETSPA